MKTEFLTACDQLVAAALNGVYQGIIVALLVALSLRVLGRTNAATRHAVWFCTLLLLVSLLVAHCLIGLLPLPHRASMTHEPGTASNPSLDLVLPVATAAQVTVAGTGIAPDASPSVSGRTPRPETPIESRPDSLPLPPGEVVATEVQSRPKGNPFPQRVSPHGNDLGRATSGGAQFAEAGVSGEAKGFRRLAQRLVNPVSMNLALESGISRVASSILLALWLIIGGIRAFVLLLQISRIRKLKRSASPPGAGLSELFQRLASRLDLKRNVELKISPAHRGSFLLGFLHPVILLPAEEGMEPGEAELVLRHELAHVRRRDDWANLVQHVVLAVFFFHPAVWWISRQLALEREIACDDQVLQHSGRPQTYALLLANLAARIQRGLSLLAPGSSNHKTQLKQRIDMILNTHRNTSPHLAKTWLAVITSAVALLAVAMICLAPRIVLAQNQPAPAAANTLSAGASDSDSADAQPRTPQTPTAVSSGPKLKPGSPRAQNIWPVVIAAPAAPAVPSTASTVVAAPIVIDGDYFRSAEVPSTASSVVAAPIPPAPFLAAVQPAPAPRAPRATLARTADASLEARLERLEQMVESLLAQQHQKPGHFDFHLKGPSEKGEMIDRKEIAKIEALAKRHAERSGKINPQELEKIQELAERQAKRATEQAKRATIQAERALKAEPKPHPGRKLKEGSQQQLEALRKQLEILEREREKLDRQIEQLEQEQLDEQRDEDEDQAGSHSQPEECQVESLLPQPSAR